jgi:cell division septum initiation protein DivIVA
MSKKEELTKSILPIETLKDKFDTFNKNTTDVVTLCNDITVDNKETCELATQHAGRATGLLNDIESLRKVIKDPYLAACKLIDDYTKTIVAPIELAKQRVSVKIKAWKVIEESRLKADEEARMKGIEQAMEKKRQIKERLMRIHEMLNARLFGGKYKLNNGEERTSPGCVSQADIDQLRKDVEEKYPRHEEFGEYKEDSLLLTEQLHQKIDQFETNLKNIQNGGVSASKSIEEINTLRTEANVNVIETAAALDGKLIRMEERVVGKVKKEIKEASKGMRTYITFEVTDLWNVPREFLMIDEKAINEYKTQNKELIIDQIKNNKQPVTGIVFKIEQEFVARS